MADFNLKIPSEHVTTLIDAINCYVAGQEGNLDVFMAYFQDDPEHDGGTIRAMAQAMESALSPQLHTEIKHQIATDPFLQELLHKQKMRQKHGN